MVWGHSLLGPCSPDELSLLAAWVKPRRGTRIALLGAGLGGFGLALSRICHCHVTGFEQADVLLRLCPDRRNGHLRSLDSITVKTEHSFDHRSEEHTSELQSLMRISYAVFCLKQKK